jgi:hypothetical protein
MTQTHKYKMHRYWLLKQMVHIVTTQFQKKLNTVEEQVYVLFILSLVQSL